MVWVTGIVRECLNELEQVHHEAVVNLHQVLEAQVLDSGHLIQQLQEQPVQTGILAPTTLDELEQPAKTALCYHGAEGVLFGPAVEEQEVGVDVELRKLVLLLLQEAVDELCPHIVAVAAEYLAL